MVEGALDYDTGQYLESQHSFISKPDTLIETSFPAQGTPEEDGESECYKAEVDENFTHAVSVIENMLETDSYDGKVLMPIP